MEKHPKHNLLSKDNFDRGAVDGSMDYEQASIDSFDAASKAVAEKLQKVEQLDNLDQIRMQVARKKATVESQLRNAVQTQLEGVQNGLERLKLAGDVVREIKESMVQVEKFYKQNDELADIISPLKEVNRRFQQLRTTNTHIDHILGVPHLVEEIQKSIEDGNLLQAHQFLSELEHTRDELLIQLHQSADAFVDRNTAIHRYFEPLIGLSRALGQQLWLLLDKVPENVVDYPSSIVTALRIVQREEKADHCIEDSLTEKGIPLSQIPGRPKKWKDKCVEIMETSISNRFSDVRPHGMAENKDWLDEYLTEVASLCYKDLKAIKESGQKCFPSDYDILEFYIKRYHCGLKEVITSLVNMELNARDIIKLMIWVGDVRQSFREALALDLQEHGALIDEKIEKQLQTTCVEQVGWNVQELTQKMLSSEKEDWSSGDPPESDNSGCYYTTVGILLFEMIDQNVSALSMLGLETKEKVLQICLKAVESFQGRYQALAEETYRSHISSGRREPPLFFIYVIAVANNTQSCIDFSKQLKKRFQEDYGESHLSIETTNLFASMCDTFENIGYRCCDMLMEMVFDDLNPVLDGLMTKDAWLNVPLDLVNKIEGTLVDYNEDFFRLKPTYHTYVIVKMQRRVLKSYFESMMRKRISLKKKDDRQKAASFIREEAKKMGNLFMRLSHATNPRILEQFAELLSTNQDTLPFIIGSLSQKYTEVKYHHVVAVLAMRGDLSKNGCVKLMESTLLTPSQPGEDREVSPPPQSYLSSSRSSRARLNQSDDKSILSQIYISNPLGLF